MLFGSCYTYFTSVIIWSKKDKVISGSLPPKETNFFTGHYYYLYTAMVFVVMYYGYICLSFSSFYYFLTIYFLFNKEKKVQGIVSLCKLILLQSKVFNIYKKKFKKNYIYND